MIGRGDSSQRWHGEFGTVELVEPGSAVVDDGGLAVAWQGFAGTKPQWYGQSRQTRSGAWRYKTSALPFPVVLPVYASNICQFRDIRLERRKAIC